MKITFSRVSINKSTISSEAQSVLLLFWLLRALHLIDLWIQKSTCSTNLPSSVVRHALELSSLVGSGLLFSSFVFLESRLESEGLCLRIEFTVVLMEMKSNAYWPNRKTEFCVVRPRSNL